MSILWYQHVGALALAATDVLVRGIRMRQLLPVSLWQAVRVNAYGDTAAMLTPARLGGEPARFAGYRREGVETPPILAALGVELVADWVFVLAVGTALAIAFGGHGNAFLPRLRATVASPGARGLVVIALLVGALGTVMLARRRWRVPAGLRGSLAESARRARALPVPKRVMVSVLTVASIGARVSILPVLVGHLAGVSLGASVLGSFVLIFGQHVLPAPAGAGGVELLFLAGFAGSVSPSDATELLLVWRWYTFLVGAGLGGVLLLAQLRRVWMVSASASCPPLPLPRRGSGCPRTALASHTHSGEKEPYQDTAG